MTAAHPLDHAAWSALTGRQAHLAIVVGGARRFDPAFGVFAAVADRSAASLEALGALVAAQGDVALLEPEPPTQAPNGFTEVSGVCTHPDHRGRGDAGALMRQVAARILERGETPFLHADASNTGAIALYERLGFRVRREVLMTRLGQA